MKAFSRLLQSIACLWLAIGMAAPLHGGVIINSYSFASAAPPASAFKATVNNSSGGFTLPLVVGVSYDFYVDWGDGSAVDHITLATQSQKTHNYPTNGSYQMSITGTMPRWYFNYGGSRLQLLSVDSWGAIAWSSMDSAFSGCSNCVSFPTGGDFSAVTNFNYAFAYCSGLTSFPLIDTSHVTNFSNAWYNCTGLTSFPLINTSAATTLAFAWAYCQALTSFPLIDTSHVTSLYSTWIVCNHLTSFPLINTSAVTNMNNTWGYCSGLTSFPLIDTSIVTDISTCFYSCNQLTSLPALNLTAATNTLNAFFNMSAMTSCNVLNLKVTTSFASSNMGAAALNTLFTNLATVTSKTITVTGSPGAGSCTTSIATGKGWTVTQ